MPPYFVQNNNLRLIDLPLDIFKIIIRKYLETVKAVCKNVEN